MCMNPVVVQYACFLLLCVCNVCVCVCLLPAVADLQMFGSSVNGFGSPKSDLDLCLLLGGEYEVCAHVCFWYVYVCVCVCVCVCVYYRTLLHPTHTHTHTRAYRARKR